MSLKAKNGEIKNPNCILEFQQIHINTRFLSHIDNFGFSLDDRYHLEIFLLVTRNQDGYFLLDSCHVQCYKLKIQARVVRANAENIP